MKAPLLPLLACFAWMVPLAAHGQIIQSSSFYNPDFRARRPGGTDPVILGINNNAYNPGSQTSGNVTWSQSASGFIQTKANLLNLADVDLQLAAYSETTGDSLVFGREITTVVDVLGIGGGTLAQTALNNLVGTSVLYSWNSSATVGSLAIQPDQLYQVSFTVTSGAGLPVNLLQSSTFGITTAGVTGASNQSSQDLNLLGLVTTGANSSNGQYTFQFKSSNPGVLDHLDFNFAASTGVGVSALGGSAGNQNVLTYSGFQVIAVPEASSASILMLCGVVGLMRRRRY